MAIPKHEDILKTLNKGSQGYGGTQVDLEGNVSKSGIPSHDSILQTIKSNPSRFKASAAISTKRESVIEEEKTEEKGGFFNRLKEIGATFKSQMPAFFGSIKAGLGIYTSKSVTPELSEDRLLALDKIVADDMKTSFEKGELETRTIRVPKEDATLKDWLTGKQYTEVEMTPEEQVIYFDKKYSDAKSRAESRTTPEEALFESAKVSFDKAEEERKEVLEKYGQADKWSGRWLVNEVAANTPQFLGSFGMGVAIAAVTKNPAAGFAAGFSSSYLQEAGSAYNQAVRAGVDEATAQDIGNNVGLINAAIEQIPLGRVLNKAPGGKQLKKSLAKNITDHLISMGVQGLLEGSTESVQEIVNNAWAKTYNENQDLLEGIPEAFLVGAVFGVGGDVIAPDGSRYNETPGSIINPEAPANARLLVEDAIRTPESQRTVEQEELLDSVISRSMDKDISPTEALRKLKEPVVGTKDIETNVRDFVTNQREMANTTVSNLETQVSNVNIEQGKKRLYQIEGGVSETPWLWDSLDLLRTWAESSLNPGESIRAVDLNINDVVKQDNGAYVAKEGTLEDATVVASVDAQSFGTGVTERSQIETTEVIKYQEEADALLAKEEMTPTEMDRYSMLGDVIKLSDDVRFFEEQMAKAREQGNVKYIQETKPLLDKKVKQLTEAEQRLEDITVQKEAKTQSEERQLREDFGNERSQLERPEVETSERILSKDVTEAEPYIKDSTIGNLDTIINEDKKRTEKTSPSNKTSTHEQDWSGEFVLPAMTGWDKFRRYMEDMNVRLKTLTSSMEKAAGGTLPENIDLYALKDMMPRVESDLIRRRREQRQEFIKDVVADGITLQELDDYALAKHAKEYNAEMNRKRAEMKLEPVDGLSGMTDAEADEILAKDNSKLEPHRMKLKLIANEAVEYLQKKQIYSKEKVKQIRKFSEYVPLYRDMGEDGTGLGIPRGITTPKNIIKRAKGSTRRVVSPIANTFLLNEKVVSIGLKNDYGRTIIDATNKYDFLKEVFEIEKNPVAKLATREFKAEIDQKFVDDLTGFAEGLGLEVFETKGQPGRHLGYYSVWENKVVRKFATSRETLAHEVGHFLDIRLGLGKKVVINKVIENEIYTHSEKEVGESPTRLANPKERFANAFSWWLTHRDLASETMPNFDTELTKVLESDSKLTPLLNIKPSPRASLETLMQDIWGKTFKFRDDVMHVKINDDEYFITIKDKDLARAIKGTNLVRMPRWARVFRNTLSIWSGFKTRWRPEFLITNFQRDMGEAFVNLNVEQAELADSGKGLKTSVIKGVPTAQKELWGYLRGGENADVDEFFKLGGDTGHYWLEPVVDAEKAIYALEKRLNGAGINKLANPISDAGEAIDALQTTVELGIRYSSYKELVARGMSKQKAVQAVADLTVNFSRQGELMPVFKTAYGFINPAVQGTSKVIRTVTSKKGRARVAKSLTGITMLGFITGMLSKLMDEEGDEQMSEWTKNHKFAFSIGNGKEVNLWSMPYGYTTFYAIGRQMADVVWGTKDVDEAFGSVLETAANSFSPFGTKLNDLTPTLLKPIREINVNDAWYDGKIHPEQIFTKTPKPNSAVYFENTSEVAIFVTEFLNRITGGSEDKRGLIDIHPDDLEYMYDQYFGGPFEFVTSTIESAARSIGGDFDPNRTPFVRQFYRNGNTQSWSYGVIYDTLDIAYKTDLSETQKERFFKAVDIGVEEGIFDQDRADGYVRDFVRAVYKIEGSLTSTKDENYESNMEKLSKASEEDLNKLLETYTPSSQRKIKRGVNKLK